MLFRSVNMPTYGFEKWASASNKSSSANENTLPTMMTRPARLSQLRKTEVRRGGDDVVGAAFIIVYSRSGARDRLIVHSTSNIQLAARLCLSDFVKVWTFVVFDRAKEGKSTEADNHGASDAVCSSSAGGDECIVARAGAPG